MQIKFNNANPCMPKNLAKQLIVESAKLLNHQQRQALLDIFMTLDQAEKKAEKTLQQHAVAQQSTHNFSQDHEYQEEIRNIGQVITMILTVKNIRKIG